MKALRNALITWMQAENTASPHHAEVRSYVGELLPEQLKNMKGVVFPSLLVLLPDGTETLSDSARTSEDGSHRVQFVHLAKMAASREKTLDDIDDLADWTKGLMKEKKFIVANEQAYLLGTDISYKLVFAGVNDNQIILAKLQEFELKTPNWKP